MGSTRWALLVIDVCVGYGSVYRLCWWLSSLKWAGSDDWHEDAQRRTPPTPSQKLQTIWWNPGDLVPTEVWGY